MRILKHIFVSLAAVFLVHGAWVHQARANDVAPVSKPDQHQVREAYARDFAQKVLAILQDQKKSYDSNKELVRRAFADSVDIDWIARFVLGKSWNDATPEQRERYTSLYRKYLTESYVAHFADDPSRRIRDIKIYSVNDGSDGEASDFTVRTEMMLADFDSLNVNYLVRERQGHYKVLDIVIENVSLIETHRNEFTALAHSSGINGVIARLENLVNAKSPLLMSMK